MKATYWQKGVSIDYKNTTEATIPAETIVDLGSRVGIAGTDILPGEVGSLVTEGVFEVPKEADSEILIGVQVYLGATGVILTASTTEGEGNDAETTTHTPVGWAVEAVSASAATVKVKIG
jgi:predicted RecA/RadA family phage recombinase